MSIDAAELEGLSEDEIRKKYDAHARGNAGVPGSKEDFSDLVAKEMSGRRQKDRERAEKRSSSAKEYKF